LRPRQDIIVKHGGTIQVRLRPISLQREGKKMIGTRDVLDEIAEWYSPDRSTSADARATGLRSAFAPTSLCEELWSTPEGRLAAAVEQVLVWHDRARQRRALLRLTDDMLADIGISRTAALREAGKAFWRC
jgi:uncharacterized protein YjiS (DUF1127 family)